MSSGKTTQAVFARRGTFRDLPNPALTKDGRTVWLTTNGVPFFDPDGNLLGYRGMTMTSPTASVPKIPCVKHIAD